jgi:nucleoside-diphosphate-sugar epimerase
VFLTGATGFIGGRLAEALHARGCRLRCLVRDPTRAGALERMGAELVPGEITDQAALAQGLAGADVAYHLAARYDVGLVDAPAMERANVEGTGAFLSAVKQAGTPRVVYVSTTVALGPTGMGKGNESSRWRGQFPTVYHRTKTMAHELALSAQAAGLPVIIVCPAWVYGPGDRGPGGRFLEDVLKGRLPALSRDPAWFSFVHVDDVVSGLVAAGELGRPGATYVLSGEDASINDFALRAAGYAGVRPPRLRIPRGLALVAAGASELVSRLTGHRLPLSREGVLSATRERWLHSHERAAAELDWRPRPLSAGLPPTVQELLREVS